MAKLTQPSILGVDVSRDELVIWDWFNERQVNIANRPAAIRQWLGELNGPVRLAVEPTSNCHLELVEQAHRIGFEVFLINPRQLPHYREAVGERNKTDPNDARLLARFLAHEGSKLRPYSPHSRQAQLLWALLKRRAVIVAAQKQLRQSLSGIQFSAQGLWSQLAALLRRIDQRMLQLIRKLGWWEDYQRCLSIPGVGALNAAALLSVFYRGAFSSADAFVSFIGMDIRVRESGVYKGKRKLSKRGEAEVRDAVREGTDGAGASDRVDLVHAEQPRRGEDRRVDAAVLVRLGR